MSQPSLLQRVRGSYLGLAVGDALGATVEFMTPAEIRHQFRHQRGRHREIVGGGWLRLPPGQVTDDTGMALALGDALIARHAIDPHAIADAFDRWMRAKPVDIGHTVRAGIARYRRTGEIEAPADPMSGGNGACMRCLPIAIATLGADESTVRRASRLQAHITHHSELSDAGTETVLLMLQAFFRGSSLLQQLHRRAHPLAEQHREFNFRRRRCDNPSGFIGDTLRVVFEGLFDRAGFEECLLEVVNRGGDADTTGAIAGMLAGAYYGEAAIPPRWLKALDPAVHRAVVLQSESLLAMAPLAGVTPVPAGA